MDTQEWPGKDPIPANRGIRIPKRGFLGAGHNHQGRQAFIPVYTVLLHYQCQPGLPSLTNVRDICCLSRALIPALLMSAVFNADHVPPKCQRSAQTDQLHFGSLSFKLETVSQTRKHPWHRTWVSHVAHGGQRSSGCFILWRTKQQDRVQGNTDTRICIVPRDGPASFYASSSFGEAAGRSSFWEQHSTEERSGQVL